MQSCRILVLYMQIFHIFSALYAKIPYFLVLYMYHGAGQAGEKALKWAPKITADKKNFDRPTHIRAKQLLKGLRLLLHDELQLHPYVLRAEGRETATLHTTHIITRTLCIQSTA